MKVLDLTLPTPAENLACDQALLHRAEAGQGGEVLRFWESPQYFVVVGYANQVKMEVNVTACEAQRIPILRRCSGGGTVLQGPGCLNYALVLRITESGPTRSISAANQFIMERNRQALAEALSVHGLSSGDVQVRGHTDLTLGGRKFSGNSQRRQRQFLLFHGTFLLSFELEKITEFLSLPAAQPAYRESRTHAEFLTHLGLSVAQIKHALLVAWQASGTAEPPEPRQVAALVAERYSRPDWNFRR